MVGAVSAATPDTLVGVAVALVPGASNLGCWLVIAFGRPYSRARPLGMRLMKIAFGVALLELILSAAWGVISPQTFPVVLVRTAFCVTLFQPVAILITVVIDTLRGGVPASLNGGGDA